MARELWRNGVLSSTCNMVAAGTFLVPVGHEQLHHGPFGPGRLAPCRQSAKELGRHSTRAEWRAAPLIETAGENLQ
jgi:hypothetical protein